MGVQGDRRRGYKLARGYAGFDPSVKFDTAATASSSSMAQTDLDDLRTGRLHRESLARRPDSLIAGDLDPTMAS